MLTSKTKLCCEKGQISYRKLFKWKAKKLPKVVISSSFISTQLFQYKLALGKDSERKDDSFFFITEEVSLFYFVTLFFLQMHLSIISVNFSFAFCSWNFFSKSWKWMLQIFFVCCCCSSVLFPSFFFFPTFFASQLQHSFKSSTAGRYNSLQK